MPQLGQDVLASGRRRAGGWILGLGWMLALSGMLAVQTTSAQEVEDPVPEDPTREAQEPPEIPETVVPARPESFPANPLGQETVLSPTRTELAVGQSGSSVTVITGDQIRRSRQTSVTEILRGTVGMDVARQGGPGSLTSAFLRGANSQHTKVLLDGIPINDPSNATRGFDFSTLSVDNIERIEVLRGPQSVLYGSDAIGGVINIITRRATGPLSVLASGHGGSYGTSGASVHVGEGNDCAYYSVSGSFLDTSGISAANRRRGHTESDGFQVSTFSTRVGWTPSDLVNIDYVARFADAEVEVDDFSFVTGLPEDNLIRRNLSRQFYQRLQWQSLMLEGGVEQTIGFNLADYRRRDTDPGAFVPAEFRGQTRQIDWQADLLLTESNVFSVGATYLEEQASSSFVAQVQQHNAAVFVQDQFQLGERWFATAGARWDDYSSAGPASTYRITNLIRLDESGTHLHGTIGTGFRAPALAENLFQFGNPNLRPERSKGWDVGCSQQLGCNRWVVDATYFRNDIQDLIIFDFNTFSLLNVGQVRSSGVELSLLFQWTAETAVEATYTYTDATDVLAGSPLLRRPRNKASLALTHSLPDQRARARLQVLYVGDRWDSRSGTLALVDQYLLVNLSGSYDLHGGWSLFARVDNLLDENYEEVLGYGTPGLAGYAGLDFRW